MPAAHRASLETHLSAQQPGLRKDLVTGPASCKPSGQRGCGAPTPPRPPRGPRVSRACAVCGGRDAAPTAPWHLPAGAPLPTRAHGACVLSGCSPRGPGHSAAGQACTPLPRGSRGAADPLHLWGASASAAPRVPVALVRDLRAARTGARCHCPRSVQGQSPRPHPGRTMRSVAPNCPSPTTPKPPAPALHRAGLRPRGRSLRGRDGARAPRLFGGPGHCKPGPAASE